MNGYTVPSNIIAYFFSNAHISVFLYANKKIDEIYYVPFPDVLLFLEDSKRVDKHIIKISIS